MCICFHEAPTPTEHWLPWQTLAGKQITSTKLQLAAYALATSVPDWQVDTKILKLNINPAKAKGNNARGQWRCCAAMACIRLARFAESANQASHACLVYLRCIEVTEDNVLRKLIRGLSARHSYQQPSLTLLCNSDKGPRAVLLSRTALTILTKIKVPAKQGAERGSCAPVRVQFASRQRMPRVSLEFSYAASATCMWNCITHYFYTT